MRWKAYLIGLTLVLSLTSCDSSTSSSSSSNSSLVGTWRYAWTLDTINGIGANGNLNDSLFSTAYILTLKFNSNGSAETQLLQTMTSVQTGKGIDTELYATKKTWWTDGDTLFQYQPEVSVGKTLFTLSSNNSILTLKSTDTTLPPGGGVYTRE